MGLAIVFAWRFFLAAPGQALAETRRQPPPDTSAIDQYVEGVPTAGGGVANGVGKNRAKALPRRVSALIARDGGSDAETLGEIASSSTYGAPQKPLAPKRVAPNSPSALSAAATATGSSGNYALWLVAIPRC